MKIKKIDSLEVLDSRGRPTVYSNIHLECGAKGSAMVQSGASTGWIATNWLEDLILSEYGSDVYDNWSNQDTVSSSDEILNSINNIGKLVFTENAIYGTNISIVR